MSHTPQQPFDIERPPLAPPELAEPEVAPGTVVAGKYIVERALASGGTGVVLLATHIDLHHKVAVKFLREETREVSWERERFLREARLAAQLHSVHVVKVHDVGTDAEIGPYMVMEYLEGKDLGQLIEHGPLPIVGAVDYTLQACEAMADVHALGVVHRDLKPENLFLASLGKRDPIIKIIDFGISKVTPREASQRRHWARITSRNETFGTPAYMSPEQIRSTAEVDARADIWALGVILYELITGVLPFDADEAPRLTNAILTDAPPPPSTRHPSLPADLEVAIMKCLEKDPGQRFRNVAELAQELSPFGPPDAEARVDRIRRIVQEIGSIRPKLPPSGDFVAVGKIPTPGVPLAPVQSPETPPQPPQPHSANTATGAIGTPIGISVQRSMPTIPILPRRRPLAPAWWGVIAASLAVIVLARVFVSEGDRNPPLPIAHAATAAPPPVEAIPEPPPVETAQEIELASPPVPSSEIRHTAHAAASHPSAVTAAPPPRPSEVSRRALYGDRK